MDIYYNILISMGNRCCVNEGNMIEIKDTVSTCETADDLIELLKEDINLLKKIEKTIILIKNKKTEELRREDKIFLEYQVFKYIN